MKYLKILALALGALTMTACSDDDKTNTAAGVSVEFGYSEVAIMESSKTLQVPIKVTGEANGPVKVSLKVEGSGTNPAQIYEDRNGVWSGDYFLLSNELNIPEGETTVYAEISLIDNVDENEAKTFTITITAADGATIGAISSAVVTIKDNDSTPYGKLQGSWNFGYVDLVSGANDAFTVNISGYDEGTPEYENLLTIEGIYENGTYLDMDFMEDETTGKIYVALQLPEPIEWWNASNYLWFMTFNDQGYLETERTVIGEVSDDLSTITFEPANFILYVAAPDLSSALGYVIQFTDVVMTKN